MRYHQVQIRRRRTQLGLVAAILFIGSVWFANWLLTRYGIIHIAGLAMPAGVLSVGVAFTLRDYVHRFLGRLAVVVCILAGCLLAYLIEANAQIPGGLVSIAVASALAFLFSELADLFVYTPIEERNFVAA